ncbi:DUF3866 family protein [Paenibacillus filicis]|uniref:DUF3866 family protein n=1 Tax=Paenibacillus gyeongsangnamensis TaxID=3388067 RepID=A0ABT4Q7K3_9BACL|nr:DUF3866 family protein [Paenibacillus filicis]MCZ8512853.1 DUF3866 family protein [Paenibacillus filicis]
MGIRWEIAVVKEIAAQDGDLLECTVRMADGSETGAFYDLQLNGPLLPGSRVLLNTTAVELGLGTGGMHFVHAVLPPMNGAAESYGRKEDASNPYDGHIMKLRYTSLQRAVLAAEEPVSPYHSLMSGGRRLDGMPVLVGELHSMLPVAVAWMRSLAEAEGLHMPRIVYVMGDGGALPIGLSRHVRRLRELDWLTGTVTYGHAYGGDVETVNKYTGLLAARVVLEADLAIVIQGPGMVGTATEYGHSGIETGELLHAAAVLGGLPVPIPRISFEEERERHRGLSHHTVTVLRDIVITKTRLPLPLLKPEESRRLTSQLQSSGLDRKHEPVWREAPSVEAMEKALSAYGSVTSMGKGLRESPSFFAAICTAAEYVFRLLRS